MRVINTLDIELILSFNIFENFIISLNKILTDKLFAKWTNFKSIVFT